MYNTCVVLNTDGNIIAKHRKVHLFDIDIPGKITFKESDSLSSGNNITVVSTPWGPLGVGICYDIRFPEFAAVMRQKGCRWLIYPGAFNMTTGPLHWELLQRARAVDNQLFVLTCSPARNVEGYMAYGYSMAVSPWGNILTKANENEQTVYCDLDFNEVETMRENIPCWKQKRNDIYEISGVDKH